MKKPEKDQAGGKYEVFQEEYKAANIWVKRTGAYQPTKFIDDVDFSLEDQTDGTCKVSAKARSEQPGDYFVRQFDVYCDLYNAFRLTGSEFSKPVVSSDCLNLKHPENECFEYWKFI